MRPSSAARRQEHKSQCALREREGERGRERRSHRAAKEAANGGGERRERVWPDNWSRPGDTSVHSDSPYCNVRPVAEETLYQNK